MLRKIVRWKSFLAISSIAILCLIYTLVDVKSMKYVRSSRKLQIAHLTAEDIRKTFDDDKPIYGEDLLTSSKDLTSNDQNIQELERKSSTARDSNTIVNSVLNGPGGSPLDYKITSSSEPTSLSLQEKQRRAIDKLAAIANNDTIFTKEKQLVALSPFDSIPVDKRKRLETYLSRLSEGQFNEVFRTVMGYENTGSRLYSENPLKYQDVERSTRASLMKKVIETAKKRKPCINGCKSHKVIGRPRGYGARVVIESVTLPEEWQTPEEVIQRLDHRKKHVKEVCHESGLDIPSANNSINAWEFLISSEHNLVWCSIFKAASSTWFYNFNILAGYSEDKLLKTKETPVSLARRKYPRPSQDILRSVMNATDPPLSFLIVRHPFTRLVSAYRDKLLPGRRYYNSLSQKIVWLYPHLGNPRGQELRTFRDPRLQNSKISKHLVSKRIAVPTFPQFIQYVIDSLKRGEHVDEHWMPMHKFCTPCLFQFDVIAKTETLDEDGNYIIFQSGIDEIIKPKHINRNRNAPTNSVAESFLCQLSRKMMEELVEVYRYDLELFEYDYEQYLNCTTDSVRLGPVR